MKPSYGSVQNSHFPWNEFYFWGQCCHPQGAHGGTVYLLTWLRCPTSNTMLFKHSILLLSRSEKPRHRSNCWEGGNCKSLFASVSFDILREPQKVLKHFSPLRAIQRSPLWMETWYQTLWKGGCKMHPHGTICVFTTRRLLVYSQVVMERCACVGSIWGIRPRTYACECISQKQAGP